MPNIFDQFDEPAAATAVGRVPSPGASTIHLPSATLFHQPSTGGGAANAPAILNPPSATLADEKATVRRPNGTVTTIPAIHLNAAIQFGYKPITQ